MYSVDLLTTIVQAEVGHSDCTMQLQLHSHITNSVQCIYICNSIQNLRKAASTDRVDHRTLKGKPVISQNVQNGNKQNINFKCLHKQANKLNIEPQHTLVKSSP